MLPTTQWRNYFPKGYTYTATAVCVFVSVRVCIYANDMSRHWIKGLCTKHFTALSWAKPQNKNPQKKVEKKNSVYIKSASKRPTHLRNKIKHRYAQTTCTSGQKDGWILQLCAIANINVNNNSNNNKDERSLGLRTCSQIFSVPMRRQSPRPESA